jgi:hypothetical protein
MLTRLRIVGIAGLALACGVPVFGQAMISYGHGVARAGAAGAASGTGIAGVFGALKDSTNEAAEKKPAQTTTGATQGSGQAAMDDAVNAPRKLTTSSGVVVSGLAPVWMGSDHREARRPEVAVKSVEWSNPDTPVGKEAVPAKEGAAEGDAASQSQNVNEPGHIIAGEPQFAGESPVRAAGELVGPRQQAQTDAEAVGIQLGSPIDEVIGRLGKPKFVFSGIVGKSYTEKYVFKPATGETITVLTWSGTVVSVLVD